MLNDNERRALADLERHLQHDPDFTARMDGLAGVPAEPPSPAVPVLCALLFITIPLVMLLFGWVGVLIALDLFAAAVALILIRRRTHR
ncbi:DUF3040 domain-containing protein [Actinoplanes sp. L3-i22]|uniref:DUF3040 domain-containing protein n=1 Tax=Actinoplanes sp. L3-i22 TaxID=2836373 RepID=UPI001C753F07|nr:DUF3040 domain-containing protein [Actinoplanes sp. L3-i22]BCY07421.1 hypothetical protein L3i22_025090 [Actinoplanes sp. L3-i22]